MYHYCYLLSFEDGMKYVGAHSTKIIPELDTTYLGSGTHLPKNRSIFTTSKIILATFETRKELIDYEINFIIENKCVESNEWYNKRTKTYDRYQQVPWNKGKTGLTNTHSKTFIERYCKGYRTPAQIAGAKRVGEKIRGTSNPAKGKPGIANSGFKPWYVITPNGEYKEFHDIPKQDAAHLFNVTARQLGHRFHYTNEHKAAKTLPLKGYVFGNLPKPDTDIV